MTLPSESRLHVEGSLDVRISSSLDSSAPEPAATRPGLRIGGRVIDRETAIPLAGFRVLAETERAGLGEGTTDADGVFGVVPGESPEIEAEVDALLAHGGTIGFRVEIGAHGSERVQKSVELGAVFVTIEVDAPRAAIGGDEWARAFAAVERSRIGRVNELFRELSSPAPGTPFAAWSAGERLGALAGLEAAFLDPEGLLRRAGAPPPTLAALQLPGAFEAYARRLDSASIDRSTRAALRDVAAKAVSFQSLADVDWVMEPMELRNGNPGAALTRFQDAYRVADRFGVGRFPAIETDLTRYRDYLREIWITVGQIYEPVQNQKLTPAQAASQLTARFHQDFFQTFVTEQPANEVLIPILNDIVQAPTGVGWGFGIPPAAIPSRGGLSAREYLDQLIALTGVSAHELGLRYRVDFTRPDAAKSSPVAENISTLQAFFRDSFQAVPDPVGALPDVHGKPIVAPALAGRAPFFLWYDEWLRQQAPFYAENHYDFRRAFPIRMSPEERQQLQGYLTTSKPAEKPDWTFIEDVWASYDLLAEGHAHYYKREYGLAQGKYEEAWRRLSSAVLDKPAKAFDIKGALLDRKKTKVTKMTELDGPPQLYVSTFADPTAWRPNEIDYMYRETSRDRMAIRLYYYLLYVLPISLGDVALAQGDYGRAVFAYGHVTRFPIGVARESDSGGYRPHYLSKTRLYHLGSRPYTAHVGAESTEYPLAGNTGEYYDTTTYSAIEQVATQLLPSCTHPIESKAARLRQANALLEWADALYRTDESSSVQRARELYKAVLYLHDSAPPINPTWPSDFLSPGPSFFRHHNENPAVTSQKARARAGFFKISQGLNWYGETDDVVPVLRYRALKEVADRFAALAKSTQQDFLLYTEKMEAAMADRMRLTNLIQKAGIQIKVAEEQSQIAQHQVGVAQAQVQVVKDQIAAKQQELEDSQDFFNQLGDFFGGMVKTFTGLPGEATGFIGKGFSSTAAGGAGVTAGLGVLAGYGAFVYAGYTSLSAMADEYSSLAGQIKSLRDKALPAAEAQVRAREREVTIAGYQRQLAEADLALARDLLTFEERRFLGLEFWSELARLMVRLLQRYLELAARTAWLAERALAYELDRDIRIVRFDYFPERLSGVTGADLVQADLAELEAVRIEGTARSVPARVTMSLAAEHPLAFGKLKQTGWCAMATTEAWLRALYPGTFGYRVRAVSAAVIQTGTLAPIRGVLVNEGISLLRPDEPEARGLVRPAEGFPISEFRLDRDLAVHGLPGESLFAFEGSGIETFWRLELPLAGNAAALSGVADVLVTFDLRAQYDPARHAKQAAEPKGPVRRWLLLSAQRFGPQALTDLRAGQAATFAFDVTAIGLSAKESDRNVTNLALAFVSFPPLDVTATLSITQPAQSASVTFEDGVAYSNVHPDPGALPQPPMALNALTGVSADRTFSFTVNPAQNPGADFSSVTDVLFAVEYEAKLV
jgi:hypothetical protein